MRHGDYLNEPERLYHYELLLFQDGPFSDFTIVDGYHYGRLATGADA